jgi:hypothetical protein
MRLCWVPDLKVAQRLMARIRLPLKPYGQWVVRAECQGCPGAQYRSLLKSPVELEMMPMDAFFRSLGMPIGCQLRSIPKDQSW